MNVYALALALMVALAVLTGCSATVPICVPEPPHDMQPVCQPGECPPMLWGGQL